MSEAKKDAKKKGRPLPKPTALSDEDLDKVAGGVVEGERTNSEETHDLRRAGFEIHGFINTDDPSGD